MSLRTALLAAIVLGLGGLGLVGWIGMQLPAKPADRCRRCARAARKEQILVAAHALRAGSLLKYDDIQAHEVLVAETPAGARIDTPQARADLIGSMIRRSLQPQEALLAGGSAAAGRSRLPCRRAAAGHARFSTVGVDAVSGTAGLIWPGDHVDVILTQVTDDRTLPASRRASAEAVLGDVRVIAIDQQLMQGATGSGPEQGTTHTVTLEVTATQAERADTGRTARPLVAIVRAADAAPDRPGSTPAHDLGRRCLAGTQSGARRRPVDAGLSGNR